MAAYDAGGFNSIFPTAGSLRAPAGFVAPCHCPDPIPPLVDIASIDSTSADAGRLGVDVDAILDVPLRWGMTSGTRTLANGIARRLSTPAGSMPDDPNYGTDIRDYVNGGFTPTQLGQIRGAVESECLKDPRVQSASVDFSWIGASGTMKAVITIEIAEGTFTLVLAASALTVDMLDVGVLQ